MISLGLGRAWALAHDIDKPRAWEGLAHDKPQAWEGLAHDKPRAWQGLAHDKPGLGRAWLMIGLAHDRLGS